MFPTLSQSVLLKYKCLCLPSTAHGLKALNAVLDDLSSSVPFTRCPASRSGKRLTPKCPQTLTITALDLLHLRQAGDVKVSHQPVKLPVQVSSSYKFISQFSLLKWLSQPLLGPRA